MNNSIKFNLKQGSWDIIEVSSGRQVSSCFLFDGKDVLQYMDEFCQYSSNFDESSKVLTSTNSTNPNSKNLPGYCYDVNGTKKHLQGIIQPKPETAESFSYDYAVTMNETTTKEPKYFGLTGVLEKSSSPIWINEKYYISITEEGGYIYLRFFDSNSTLIKEEKREKNLLLEPYLYFVKNNLPSVKFKNLKFSFTGNHDELSEINDSFAYRGTYPYMLTRTDGDFTSKINYFQTENLINKIQARLFFEYLNPLQLPCFTNKIQEQSITFSFDYFTGEYKLDNESLKFPKFRSIKQINNHNYTGVCKSWNTIPISQDDQTLIANSFNLSNHCSLMLGSFNADYNFFNSVVLKIPSNVDWEYGWFGSGRMGIPRVIGPFLGTNAYGVFITDDSISLKNVSTKKEHWNEAMGSSYFEQSRYDKHGYPHGNLGSMIWHSVSGPQTNNFLSSWDWREWIPGNFGCSEQYTIWVLDKDSNEEVYWSGTVTSKAIAFPRFMSRYHNYSNEYIKHQGNREWINGTEPGENWQSGLCILRQEEEKIIMFWADAGFPSESTSYAPSFRISETGISGFEAKTGQESMLVDWLWHLKKTS